jgi:hypothetical protein
MQPQPTQMTLHVNNALIPAILGRGGVVLKEIQVLIQDRILCWV